VSALLFRAASPLRFAVFGWFAVLLSVSTLIAAEAAPAAPSAYFNDYANAVPPSRAREFNARLAQFERDTSTQLLVVIYPRLPERAALEDYTVRAAQAWGAGRKDRDNGAVLFVFVADRALRIEVGYGLEGTLTDAVAHAIIENELKPRLRAGDPAGAFDAAITAMINATRGEYQGPARTVRATTPSGSGFDLGNLFFIIIAIFCAIVSLIKKSFGHSYTNPYRRPDSDRSWGGWSGGGGSSGGSSSGGGFSGGGGGFGGGGASGKW
jgi:uncharacterized protein